MQSANASAVDGSGATLIAGGQDVDPAQTFSFDAVLTKVDRDGVVEWVRSYDEPTGGSQQFEFLGLDAAGNVVVAGRTHVPTQTIVARYDTSGNQIWLRTLSGPSGQPMTIAAMRVAPTGEITLAGSVTSAPSNVDALVVRLRADGTTAWTHAHDGSAGRDDKASDVVVDAVGNAFVTGQAGTPAVFVYGLLAFKVGFDGTPAWNTELLPPATAHHQAAVAAVDAQGRMYVANNLLVNDSPFLDIRQFDVNGALVWNRQIPVENAAGIAGLFVRADGSLVLGARLLGAAIDAPEAFVGAWDATGAALWSASYHAPGPMHEFVTDFDLDPAGGSILSGWHGSATNTNVLFVAHFTDDGQQDWTQILGSASAHESAAEIDVASDESLRIRSNWIAPWGDIRLRLRRLEHDVTAFCSGDGSATICPCGNSGAPHSGCANSFGVGAALGASGSASLSFDTLRLRCEQLPQTTVLFFQGTERAGGGSGVAFGDGLRCAGGSVVRLDTALATGFVDFPGAGQSLSLVGLVTAPGLRTYQCWYRNGASFCTPDTFNTSNGLAVLWRP